jgi:tetratricopeptide (TPR) repeat protein
MRTKSDVEQTKPVYFLLHIPKTAGQTIQVHLAEHCAPGVFWQSQRKLRPGRPTGPGDLPDFDRARVISGHHIGRSLEKFFPGREIRRVVLLRDPLQLQISFYNWRMMNHLAKGLGTYRFALHLQALPRNFASHFILARWLEIPWPRLMAMSDSRKYDLLNRAFADFWFVGAHSDCDRVINAISADLGVPPVAAPRNTSAELQPNTGWRLVTEKTLVPAMRDAVLKWSSLDQALWESWGGAGFEPGGVAPRPLGPGRKSAFLAHEIVRPGYALARFVQCQWPAWLRRGGGEVSSANSARDAGQWETAARRYRLALQAIPNASAIWVQYGHALKEAGHLAEAEQAYRRSLTLCSDRADTHLQLGHALKLQGRVGEAEAAYLRSAALDPAGGYAHQELIGLGWTNERIDRAVHAQPAPAMV